MKIEESALDSLKAMVQQLQEQQDALIFASKEVLAALHESRPIETHSVLMHNKHAKAIKNCENIIAACTETKQVLE